MATKKPIEVDELYGDLEISSEDDQWYVIHTKPRCEKKIAKYALNERINYYLPQIDSIRKYKNREVKFTKPMFPSYFFAKCNLHDKRNLLYTGYIANFLKVINEKVLTDELKEIYTGKSKGAKYHIAKYVKKGTKVLIISGSLKGITGYVEDITEIQEIILNISLLRQAVSVKVSKDQVKILRK